MYISLLEKSSPAGKECRTKKFFVVFFCTRFETQHTSFVSFRFWFSHGFPRFSFSHFSTGDLIAHHCDL